MAGDTLGDTFPVVFMHVALRKAQWKFNSVKWKRQM